jgi:hypothetical protein
MTLSIADFINYFTMCNSEDPFAKVISSFLF